MKLSRLALPAAILGAATLATLPRTSEGYAILGNSNNADWAGFKVYQASFTDPQSNANVTPDANFPGSTGAAMALWKAAAEWNSELRAGNGNGDSHQPGGLGSGGSNYDWMYHGIANNAGGNFSAVISAGGFLGGGVLAVTYLQGNNGWTMAFDNSQWTWDDGPGTSISGMDIEGIGCHELGHALGLGHTNVGGATMYPTVAGNGVSQRSIEADDSNGIKAVYGTKSGTKPTITGVTGNKFVGGSITITGANFSATANEVWFSRDTGGNTGSNPTQPVKVTSLTSNGTSITCTVPAGVLKGEIIVHSSGATSIHSIKSAPYPFDLQAAPSYPVISGLSPNPIPTLAVPAPVLTIDGTNFDTATSVAIGTKVYTAGQFQIVNANQIKVDFNPPPVNIGTVNVTIQNPNGVSAPAQVTLALPASNVMLPESQTPASGSSLNLWMGSGFPGEVPLVAFSQCLQTITLPPYVTLAIGGCGDLDFLPTIPPPFAANGITSQNVTIPAGFHGLVFVQFCRLNLANPVFPMTASNFSFMSVP